MGDNGTISTILPFLIIITGFGIGFIFQDASGFCPTVYFVSIPIIYTFIEIWFVRQLVLDKKDKTTFWEFIGCNVLILTFSSFFALFSTVILLFIKFLFESGFIIGAILFIWGKISIIIDILIVIGLVLGIKYIIYTEIIKNKKKAKTRQ